MSSAVCWDESDLVFAASVEFGLDEAALEPQAAVTWSVGTVRGPRKLPLLPGA